LSLEQFAHLSSKGGGAEDFYSFEILDEDYGVNTFEIEHTYCFFEFADSPLYEGFFVREYLPLVDLADRGDLYWPTAVRRSEWKLV